MLEIKDITGQTRLSVPINIGAKGKFTLMKEDYIVLPFSLPSPIAFRIGDWVDLTGVLDESLGGMLSKRYEITEIQKPTYNDNTGGYDYKLKLNAYYWKWKNKIFKYTPEHAGSEASWSLTATLDVQLGVFLRNLKALGYLFNGQEFTFEIDSSVENKAVPMVYDNMNLLDALFSMASKDKWNCDCWVTDNVIHFGRNEYGDSVKLELGVEASAMTHSESKGTYATRIYAFGSTRNIPANYRPASEQAVVNGVVQKRLMLPVDTPYIDAYEGMSQEEAIEDIVVFDDVYPRRMGTLSNVKTVDRKVDNPGEGEPSTFKAYQYKDAGLIFKKEYILEEQELEVTFQSGKLNGMKFGVVFEPEGASKQTWEIVANEDYGRLLPDETICPTNGDKYVLTGFNIQLVSDQYIPSAEKELKEKAIKYAGQRKRDDGTYNTTLNSVWVYEDKLKRFFEFGQKVNLVNKAFFETGRESRILGWELNLDIPWDSPSYVIGESMPYSRIGEIEGEVESLTYKGQAYAGGGNGVYLIKTNDRTAPSNSNAFSAKRTLISFLNKDRPDQTDFLQKFLGGLISTYIQSPEFLPGVMGHGFTLKQNEDGTTYAEVDKLMVRMKAIFQSLEIMKTELAGASFMFNASGARATITRVERIDGVPLFYADGKAKYHADGKRAYVQPSDYGAVYRCYFLTDDGDVAIENRFRIGNLARSQTFNIKEGTHEGVSNRYWWRLVTAVGDNWIDLSVSHCDEGSDIPQEGDVIVQLGDLSDTDYQSAIALSAYGDSAPSLIFYQGINSYSLAGCDVFSLDYDRLKKEVSLRSYGRAYIGDRERKSYFAFDPLTRKATFRGEFLFESGESIGMAVGNDIAKKIGYASYDELNTSATGGATIIKGGRINTSLIMVNELFAGTINAENATITNATLTEADVSGKITAKEGSIGGFAIAQGRIGAEYTSSSGYGLSITGDSIRVGDARAVAYIGTNSSSYLTGGATAARFESRRIGTIIAKIALTDSNYTAGLDVRTGGMPNGGHYYGLVADQPCIANAFIRTRLKYVYINNGNYTDLDLSLYSVFLLQSTTNTYFDLPTESTVRSLFSLPLALGSGNLPSDFALEFLLKVATGSYRITVRNVCDANGNMRNYDIAPGDSLRLLLMKNGGFRYYCIGYMTD